MTVVFQAFPGQDYFFFQTFQGILFIFIWTKTLQKWVLNAEISHTRLLLFPDFSRHFVHLYLNKNITKVGFKCWNFSYNVVCSNSKYRMGLKFWSFELQMLCVTNCKKINNCIGNQHLKNRHLHFPCQHYSFQGFFQTFPYLWSFSRLFKALKISTLHSRTFHTFPGSVRTLQIAPSSSRCNVTSHS